MVREDVARLIYLYLASMNFFHYFTVEKTSLSLPALRLSCLYIQWVAYKYAICKECFVDKISLRTEISCVPRENEGFGTVCGLILSEKILIFH